MGYFGAYFGAYFETPAPAALERFAGGYGWSNLHTLELRRLLRRKLRREDDEDRVRTALKASGAALPPVASDPQAGDLKRLKALVAAYKAAEPKTQRAVAYAKRARTTLGYELALRQITQELDDEEHAVLMALALLD